MGGEPNPFYDRDVSAYLDEKEDRITELERALCAICKAVRLQEDVLDPECSLVAALKAAEKLIT